MASVTIDVNTRVVDRDLRKSAYEIQRSFQNLGQDAGRQFGQEFSAGAERGSDRVVRAMDRSAVAVEKVTKAEERLAKALKGNDLEAVISAQDRLARVRRDMATQDDRLHASTSRLAATMAGDLTNAATSASEAVTTFGASAAKTGASVATFAPLVGAAGVAVASLGGVAASAAGALNLLPAAITGVAGVVGTLALGLHGVDDALANLSDPQKFSESLTKLSSGAQRAMLAVYGLMPAFTDLQREVQDDLFKGIGPQLTATINAVLPQVRELTTGIAGALNTALSGVMGEAQSASIATLVKNIVTAFQDLAPAAAPFIKAITDLSSAGSGALPMVATSLTNAANAFSDLVSESTASGAFQTALISSLNTLSELVGVAENFVDSFMQLAPISDRVLPGVVDSLNTVAQMLPTIADVAVNAGNGFEQWVGPLQIVKTIFDGLDTSVGRFATQVSAALSPIQVLTNAVNSVRWFLDPNYRDSVSPEAKAQAALDAAKQRAGMGIGGPGGGPFGGTAPPVSNPAADAWLRADQAARPPSANGLPPGAYRRRDGSIGYAAPPSAQTGIPSPLTGPGAGGGASRPDVQVPYPGTDPMSLIQGFPVTASLYQSAQSVIESQHKLAQDQAILNALEKDNTATAAEIQKAKNDLIKDQQDQHEAELRLTEAKKSATDANLKASKTAADAFANISAGLDSDLGLSKGLSGLADNAVRFIGKMLMAPVLGALQEMGAGNGKQTGSGLIGMLASRNASGPSGAAGTPGVADISAWQPGGNVAAMMNLAQASSGNVKYAAASDLIHGLADCSGSISDLVEVLQTGQSSSGRLFDTTDFATDADAAKVGALPGYMPGALNVGVNPYPGQSGHMAATLPNGVNFEGGGATGGGAQYGGGAAGALDPQFAKQYYFPIGAGAPTVSDLYSPANTNPALNNPVAPAGGGPGPIAGNQPQGYPLPVSPAGPLQYATPPQPAWQPSGGGYKGVGGAPMAALSAATSMIPGAGAAAETASQLINRTVGFAGQAASIGISGLLETFGLGDTLGNLQNSWPGRILSGFAGAGAALPNSAGENKTPVQQSVNDGKNAVQTQQAKGGPTVNIENFTQAPNRNGQQAAKELAYMSYAKGGR